MTTYKPKGFIAVLTVIALLAFSVSLTLGVVYLSLDESQSGLALAQGEAVLHVAEGCAEDAILQAERDENYDGDTYSYLGASCTVALDKDDTAWTFTVTAEKSGFSRTLEIAGEGTAGAPGTFTLASWLES